MTSPARVLRGLLVVALCAAIVALVQIRPTGADKGGPLTRHGELGAQLRGETLHALAHRDRTARTIAVAAGDEYRATDGVLLVVPVTVTAVEHSLIVDAALLTADGSRYRPVEVPDQLTADVTLHPGIPMSGAVVFQVPRDRLAGAALVLLEAANTPVPAHEELRIDLDVDAAGARRMLATDGPAEVPQVSPA
ncbi:MAG: hypothetical protein GEV10_05765 [Streptosporangiales bacterium]|nr:hypothetical protein [Streptosporangiales bacterium]